MRSPFPAHSPSGHGVGDCWCQDSATGPTLLAAVALVEHWSASSRVQDMSLDEMHALEDRLDALTAAARRETP